MRKVIILLSLLLISPVLAQSIIIDDFELIDPRNMQFNTEPTMELVDGVSGNALSITLDSYQYMTLFKQNISIDLSHPFSYYNISFWYYKLSGSSQCDGGDYGNFMLTATVGELDVDDPDADWKVFQYHFDGPSTDHGMADCNHWNEVNIPLENYDWENWNSNISADHLGLFGFEITQNPDTTVYFDEVKLVPKEPTVVPGCDEDWSCTEWSECSSGDIQTRTCTDANNCGSDVDKPAEMKSCFCVNEWSCGDWSLCFLGSQSRDCVDLNGCRTQARIPDEIQSCYFWEPFAFLGVVLVLSGVLKLYGIRKQKKPKEKKKPRKRKKALK